MTDIHIISNRI